MDTDQPITKRFEPFHTIPIRNGEKWTVWDTHLKQMVPDLEFIEHAHVRVAVRYMNLGAQLEDATWIDSSKTPPPHEVNIIGYNANWRFHNGAEFNDIRQCKGVQFTNGPFVWETIRWMNYTSCWDSRTEYEAPTHWRPIPPRPY